jgi:ribosomal protein S18 acetylase RimI-like enzyme
MSALGSAIRLSSEPDAPAAQVASISDAIDESNMAITGLQEFHRVAIFLRDAQDRIRGGVTGGVWGGWFHVVGLWVDEDLRGQGLGRDLMLAAEQEALSAGARHAFLETHTFQAPGLYSKLGYTTIAALDDYPPGQAQLIMCKPLVDTGDGGFPDRQARPPESA